jgi:D-amino-acid oxidase
VLTGLRIPTPDLSDAAVQGVVAGLRPHRAGGLRLEAERRADGRLVIHDYGHGGSGVSLSWGSARASVDLLAREEPGTEAVAVLGAGVVGLTTAYVLLEAGHAVAVHARRFPPRTESDVAPAIFNLLGHPGDRRRLDALARDSFARFATLVGDATLRGVSPLEVLSFKPPAASSMATAPAGTITREGPSLRAAFDHGPARDGVRYRTLVIDTATYLRDLLAAVRARGAELHERWIDGWDDLTERVVFDCAGLGARELACDDQVMSIRGHLVELAPVEGLTAMVAGPLAGEIDLYLIPLGDRLVLGGSYEAGIFDPGPDPAVTSAILAHARRFFGLDG